MDGLERVRTLDGRQKLVFVHVLDSSFWVSCVTIRLEFALQNSLVWTVWPGVLLPSMWLRPNGPSSACLFINVSQLENFWDCFRAPFVKRCRRFPKALPRTWQAQGLSSRFMFCLFCASFPAAVLLDKKEAAALQMALVVFLCGLVSHRQYLVS